MAPPIRVEKIISRIPATIALNNGPRNSVAPAKMAGSLGMNCSVAAT